jgi:hypothetical protein
LFTHDLILGRSILIQSRATLLPTWQTGQSTAASRCILDAFDPKRVRAELVTQQANKQPIQVASDLGAGIDYASALPGVEVMPGVQTNLRLAAERF